MQESTTPQATALDFGSNGGFLATFDRSATPHMLTSTVSATTEGPENTNTANNSRCGEKSSKQRLFVRKAAIKKTGSTSQLRIMSNSNLGASPESEYQQDQAKEGLVFTKAPQKASVSNFFSVFEKKKLPTQEGGVQSARGNGNNENDLFSLDFLDFAISGMHGTNEKVTPARTKRSGMLIKGVRGLEKCRGERSNSKEDGSSNKEISFNLSMSDEEAERTGKKEQLRPFTGVPRPKGAKEKTTSSYENEGTTDVPKSDVKKKEEDAYYL